MNEIALDVLKERYFQSGETKWEDITTRVSWYIAGGEGQVAARYKEMMDNFEFIPNSPCLMNAGTVHPMLSACFAVGLEDSMEGIFDSVKACALIHKVGGGTGIDFSILRPEGAVVKSTGGTSSGPISFMKVFNQATDVVKQAGKRRGANLGALDVDHPDIKKFIECKKTEGSLANFNISIKITDDFMERAVAGDPEAREIYDMIVEGNWRNGEPGILFVDAREADNLTPVLGKLDKQNPCAETTLLPWESCTLGSINLMKCLDGNKFDWGKFQRLIVSGIRFLDTVIDKNEYPLPQIEEATKLTRRLGLGVMGLADLFIVMGVKYGSSESIEMCKQIFEFMREHADDESARLAARKGFYPGIDRSRDYRRNASVLSIAPTGTISLFADASSGIEPNFGYVYKRYTWVSGEKVPYRQVHTLFAQALLKLNDKKMAAGISDWMYDYGTIQNCPIAPDWMKNIFVTAKDIPYMEHLMIQAVCQESVDQAISKTINCQNSTTKEEISDIIINAWELGCKGVTIYREGSRDDVVLETNATANKKSVALKKDAFDLMKIADEHLMDQGINPVTYRLNNYPGTGRILPKTPDYLPGGTWPRRSGCGKMIISIGEAYGGPHTVNVSNEGGGCHAMTNAVAKLVALCLRWGVPRWDITKVLRSVDCRVAMMNPRSNGKSCADIIGRVLMENFPTDDAPAKTDVAKLDPTEFFTSSKTIPMESNTHSEGYVSTMKQVKCPQCGEGLVFESGCRTCSACGWSKCS